MKMIPARHIPLFLFLFSLSILCVNPASGQYRDFQTRGSFEVSMDLTKDLKGSLEIGQRFRDNSLRYDRSLLTAAVKYDLPKGFSLAGGARYMMVQNSELNLVSKYRLHGDVNYGFKFASFELKLRERVQFGFDDIISTANTSNKLTSRSKAGLEYKIFGTPLVVYSSYEIYLVMNDPSRSPYSLNKVTAGVNINLPKRLSLDLYYLLEDEVNTTYPKQAHIFVAALGLKL